MNAESRTPVDAQPLLAQARRLTEALNLLGEPLNAAARDLLRAAERERDDAKAVALVQRALDPLCLAQVTIGRGLAVEAMPGRPALYEQGWRTVLVKVINDAGTTQPLRVQSPNARALGGAPAGEVAGRWLDLETFTQQPLSPNLSGLGLEYALLQIYSRAAGVRPATLLFNAGPVAGGGPLPSRVWRFDRGSDGWIGESDCTLSTAGGALSVVTRDRDPFMVAPVALPAGDFVLRFHAKLDHDDFGQVFWATEDRPEFDGGRQATFAFVANAWSSYQVPFTSPGDLRKVRLDFGQKAGRVLIDHLELAMVDGPTARWTPLNLTLTTAPSRPVRLTVRDERGRPTTARFTIRDRRGRIYPPQAKRLAPDFPFQSQIYRRDGESVRLPDGVYTVECQRGPESVPEVQTLTVDGGPAALSYRVKRWIDPSRDGWWSGDHHIHAAGCAHYTSPTEGVLPEDMARHTQGEDLKVGCNLTWGPCFDYQKQFFTGKNDKAGAYPYLLRYDIEVSGFGSHQSGHLCLLRLKDQIYPGGASKDHWPTLCLNTLRWAKRQGAITGFAHSGIGIELPRRELPCFDIPRFNGIGAVEYIVDVTHMVPGPDGREVPAVDFISAMDTDIYAELNIWYHTLNVGYRTRISGETDFPCLSGERVGKGRSYVQLDGRLDYERWTAGIQAGRCYVSDGATHLMDFALDGAPLGTVDLALNRPGSVAATVRAAAQKPSTVEVVVNGYPVASAALPGDGRIHALRFDVPIRQSSWVALRVLGAAHTNPIWVSVAGKPVRASAASARWCRAGVDACWKEKERLIAPAEQSAARAAYDHARRTYDRLLAECSAG